MPAGNWLSGGGGLGPTANQLRTNINRPSRLRMRPNGWSPMSIPPYDRSKARIAESFRIFNIDPCPPAPQSPSRAVGGLRSFSHFGSSAGIRSSMGTRSALASRTISRSETPRTPVSMWEMPPPDISKPSRKQRAASSSWFSFAADLNRRTCGPTIFLDDFVRCRAMNWGSKQVGA